MNKNSISTENQTLTLPKIQSPYANRRPQKKEKWLPSLTIPDDTMDLKHIVRQHSNGIPTMGKIPIYDEEGLSLGINPKTLDYVDIQNMKNENLIQINSLRAQQQAIFDEIRENQQKQQLLDFESAIRAKVEKELQATR